MEVLLYLSSTACLGQCLAMPDTQRMPRKIQVEMQYAGVRKSIPQLNYLIVFSPKVPLAKIASMLEVVAKLPLSNPYQLLSEHLLPEALYVSVCFLCFQGGYVRDM